MWKRIGIRGDGSPVQAGGVNASPLSSSRERYVRKRPLNQDSLRERDLSSSRISESSGRMVKMTSESSMILDAFKSSSSHKANQQQSANKTEQSVGKAADANSSASLKEERVDTKQSDPAIKDGSPSHSKMQKRPSVTFVESRVIDLKTVPNTDRPSGSSSARDLRAQAQARQAKISIPPLMTNFGAENATNEYIEMLANKRKEAEAKNIRYEMKLKQMTKLQGDYQQMKKELLALKKSHKEYQQAFAQEARKRLEEEIHRRSKIEQEAVRQAQQERDELRIKLRTETDKANKLKIQLDQAKATMQDISIPSKQPHQPVATAAKPTVPEVVKQPVETVSHQLQKPKEEKNGSSRVQEKASSTSVKEEERHANKFDAVAKPAPIVKEAEVKHTIVHPKPNVASSKPEPKVVEQVQQKAEKVEKLEKVEKTEKAQHVTPANPTEVIAVQPAKETPAPIISTPVKQKVEPKVSNPETEKPGTILQKNPVNTTSLPVIQKPVQVEKHPTRAAYVQQDSPPTVRESPIVQPASELKMPSSIKKEQAETLEIKPTVVKEDPKPLTASQEIKVSKVQETPKGQEGPEYENSISTILGAISKLKTTMTELSSCKQSLQEKASQPEVTKSRRLLTRSQKLTSP